MEFTKKIFKNKQNIAYAAILILIAIFGIILRCFAYFSNPSMWYDEVSLALNIDKNIFLPPLINNQSAPFLFLILAKICSIFSHSNFSFRFLPFISGLISIPVFYMFAKTWIKSKFGIILALFIFCINFRLIYFSKEFKPYSLDVLIFMIAIIYYFKIDFRKINLKTHILNGFTYALLPLVSFASLFVLPVCFLFSLFKIKENPKGIAAFIAPTIVLTPLYYFLFLNNYSNNEYFLKFWTEGFVSLKTILPAFIKMFDYFMKPLSANLFLIIAIITGFIMCIFSNKKETVFLINILFFVALASILHKYPMIDRLVLFLLPVMIVFAFKIFDVSTKKNWIPTIITILAFGAYTFADLNKALNSNSYEREAITGLLTTLKHEYKENEYIIALPWSDVAFAHYNKLYKLPENNLIISKENHSTDYTKPFWNLPKGTYWIIFTIQSDNYTRYLSLQEWLDRDFEIINVYKDHFSRMYYAKKIK